MTTEVLDEPLPRYDTIESIEDLYYGIDVALTAEGKLFLQCDKYRDYFTLAHARNGRISVLAYAHDEGDVQEVGSIAPTRFTLLRRQNITVTVKNTFTMRNSSGPRCAYSSFIYMGHAYIWRIKYGATNRKEQVRCCSLLKDERLVAAFVTNRVDFAHGVQLLGNLFLKCHAAQWPAYEKLEQREKVLMAIGYHEKDAEADLMLVSFVAIWLRVLEESLTREPHELLLSI